MSENARRDLKEGLGLYTSENNAGLSNAWNTIQTEVTHTHTHTHTQIATLGFLEGVFVYILAKRADGNQLCKSYVSTKALTLCRRMLLFGSIDVP